MKLHINIGQHPGEGRTNLLTCPVPEYQPIPDRLAVLGCGLLGTSVALAAKAARPDCEIVGFDISDTTLLNLGDKFDRIAPTVGEAVDDADAICIAVNVLAGPAVLEEIAPELRPDTFVFDTLSTKRSIVDAAELVMQSPVRFVGSHPMAGGEKGGPEAARADLFKNAPCIVTPNAATDEQSLLRVESFWSAVGCRVTRMYPSHHDRLAASVSHMPHIFAAAMVRHPEDLALNHAGTGFRDATRIAAGDAKLWADIITDNRDEVLLAMEECVGELREFATILQEQTLDREAMIRWLDGAARRRKAID
ncbi:MAG: prephenate dehydrogenase/arogenate dehydrogenase family protein [Planctomycetota bacterium]